MLFLFLSCDPGYRILVNNNGINEVKFITSPPIEKNIFNNESDEYQSINELRTKESDSINGIYILPPNKSIFFFHSIGFAPTKDLPYKKITVVKKGDSIEYSNLQIIDRLEKRGNVYYFNIK